MEDNILKIKQIIEEQLARVERMKANNTPTGKSGENESQQHSYRLCRS